MKTAVVILLAGLVAALFACPVLAAPNLLTNPSFEDGYHGAFPNGDPDPMKQYAPTGWMNPGADAWQYFQGVFDGTWKNPSCEPTWPSALAPYDGSYALGHWFPPQSGCEYDATHMSGRSSYVYQTITGLTPGTTYYYTAYYATQHPHFWGMFRMVCLPQNYDEVGGTFTPALHDIYPIHTPLQEGGYLLRSAAPAEEESATWPYYIPHWASSDERWSKITGEVTLGAEQDSVTLFLAYLASSNNLAEPQYIQVDNVRLATHSQLEIKNVEFTNFTTNTATIEWDVMDGGDMVAGLGTPANKTYVKYGATAAYGSTANGVEIDPVLCDGDRHGRPGHYAATISGLTAGNTYHFAVATDEGTFTRVPPFECPGSPSTYSRLYEANQTTDGTFQMLPLLTITNVQVTNITSTSARVTWTTNAVSDSKVRYRMFDLPYEEKTNGASTTSHVVDLTGLEPSTTYTFYVQSQGTGYNLTTNGPNTFSTTLGPNVMNGGFELRASTGATPKYWTQVPLAGGLNNNRGGEWSVPAHNGTWNVGAINNGVNALNKLGIYQKVATTPGQVISFYCYSFAAGQAQWGGDEVGCTDNGAVHRFGENNNQIGVDPTGALPGFPIWKPTVVWSEQFGSMDFGAYWPDAKCSHNAVMRRLAVCALATSNTATLYLRARCWWANNWVMNFFDDAYLEPPTELNSVAALKAQDMQLNVNLTQPAQGQGFVVTHVVSDNTDSTENKGEPYFYIEDVDRAGAIKVTLAPGTTWPSWIAPGKKVNITGTYDWGVFWNYTHQNDVGDQYTTGGNIAQQLRMDKPCGEPVVRAVVITDAGTGTVPEPVGCTNIGLGGGSSADAWFTRAGVAGGYGANNVGMRVRIWGKVVEKITQDFQPVGLVIDDGSALPPNGLGMPAPSSLVPQTLPGIYIRWSGSWPLLEDNSREIEVGDYAVLTGISAVRPDLDWDDANGWLDPGGSGNSIPEALKNMRAIKVQESRFFALPE